VPVLRRFVEVMLMKAFRLIGAIILTALGLLYVAGLMLPAAAHMERSIVIEASPADIFTVLNDLHRFNDWSPWYARDPEAEYRYDGAASGVGARMSWVSELPEVGSGSQEIIASEPDRMVETLLDFGSDGTATARFEISPEGSGSRVTWSLDVEFGGGIPGRYLGLIFDQLMGPDYEAGLASLRALLENRDPT